MEGAFGPVRGERGSTSHRRVAVREVPLPEEIAALQLGIWSDARTRRRRPESTSAAQAERRCSEPTTATAGVGSWAVARLACSAVPWSGEGEMLPSSAEDELLAADLQIALWLQGEPHSSLAGALDARGGGADSAPGLVAQGGWSGRVSSGVRVAGRSGFALEEAGAAVASGRGLASPEPGRGGAAAGGGARSWPWASSSSLPWASSLLSPTLAPLPSAAGAGTPRGAAPRGSGHTEGAVDTGGRGGGGGSGSEVELEDLSYESLLQLDDRVQRVGLKQPQLDKLARLAKRFETLPRRTPIVAFLRHSPSSFGTHALLSVSVYTAVHRLYLGCIWAVYRLYIGPVGQSWPWAQGQKAAGHRVSRR